VESDSLESFLGGALLWKAPYVMHQAPHFCRSQPVALADHLVFAFYDEVEDLSVRNSAERISFVPVFHLQLHRLHQLAFSVSVGAMAHRAIVAKYFLRRRENFRRRLDRVCFFRSCPCRRRCRSLRRLLLRWILLRA